MFTEHLICVQLNKLVEGMEIWGEMYQFTVMFQEVIL